MLYAGISRPRVCLSHAGIVSKRLNVGSRKQRHVIAHGPGTRFSDANSCWRTTTHSPWNMRSKWPTPFRTQRFRPICAHSASTVRAVEKSSIRTSLMGSWPRAFQRAIDETCTLGLSVSPPKGGTKRDFAIFVSTSATSFPYLTVHRRIAGDVPIYLIHCTCTESDTLLQKTPISTDDSASTARASKK